MATDDSAAAAVDHEVVVIGAGPGGIAAGVMLTKAGIDDFVILERAGGVGGSWRDNTYPGIGVDIPAIAYQYSFARKPNWVRLFPRGAEVKAYHQTVASRFGLHAHLRFHTEVIREEWHDRSRLWRLHTATGEIITARFVITAVGAFINPKDDVGIPGVGEFEGKIQRPASWDHGHDHTDQSVGLIGTGASSVQIAPAIAGQVRRLEVFQRTPVWCLPKPDLELPPWFQRALRIPGVAAGLHGIALATIEVATRLITSVPLSMAKPGMRALDAGAKRAYRAYLRRVVGDPATAAALAPGYGPFGKRPTISNGYLQAFNRPNTHLVSTPIERFTKTGIRTVDGVDHEFDMIVLATGYELFSDPESYRPGAVVGRDGFDLGRFYAEHRLQAYESVAVPGLPNRWMLVGPYSWTGTGWHALVEITARHAVRAIAETRRRGATTVEVRQQAHDDYHAEVRRRGRVIQHYFTVQNRGLRTYYVNSQGDMPYIRPSTVLEARHRSRHFPFDDYRYE
jgi:cation diffusion facilitator CzcD-associated flavoprotein CzcO